MKPVAKPVTLLARKAHFRCAHYYAQNQFSPEKNKEIFGACYTPHGHGHTYSLEAYFEGEIDSLTGMIINLTEVDALLKASLSPVQDKHLNLEVPEFKDLIPTTENLAHYLMNQLNQNFKNSKVKIHRLRLYESDSLWVDL